MISTFAVFIDANVFFGARIRSLFIEIAQAGLFRARWSDHVHDEWIGAVLRRRPDLDRTKLHRVRELMNAAVPDCLVTGYDGLIPAMNLPDPDDRHVLAAAVVGHASCIVTFNQTDFPNESIREYGIHTQHPDRFLIDLEGLEPGTLVEAARADRRRCRSPPLTVDDYLGELRRCGLPGTAEHLSRIRVLLET